MKLNKEAINNLEKNRNVSTSLKSYTEDMTALTYHAGVVVAAMNAYAFYERICDEDCGLTPSVKNYFQEFCNRLQTTLLKRCRGMEMEMGRGRLNDLRNEIIREAQKHEDHSDLLEQYADLLEILNPVYAAFLVSAIAGKPEKEVRPCLDLLTLIGKAVTEDSCRDLEEEAMPLLIAMEGLQERYYQPLYRYQLAFQDIADGFSETIQKKGLTGTYRTLDVTRKLLSSSPFAPL